MNDHNISSSSDEDTKVIHKQKTKSRKRRSKEEIEAEKKSKLAAQEERKIIRENAKRAKLEEKALKLKDKYCDKLQKPAECIKLMTCVMDQDLVESSLVGGQLVKVLQESLPGLQVRMCRVTDPPPTTLPLPGSVMWHRQGQDREEEEMLVLLSGSRLIDLVSGCKDESFDYDLDTFTAVLKSLNKRITLIIMNLEKEMKNKTKVSRSKPGTNAPRRITREMIDIVLLDLQIDSNVTARLCESSDEVAMLVRCYTKAVAQRPYKCERLDSQFSFDAGSSCGGCRVNSTDASMPGRGGVDHLWRQQMLQWRGVTGDMASAVINSYPTPASLYQAYQGNDGVRLVENLEIRRGAGVLASTRRVGKEFSRRLHELFTFEDPNHVIL